jgi:hypothetical protein
MRPEVTALLDQAGAATTHAAAMMAAISQAERTPIQHTRPGPILGALIGRLQQRALGGQLTLCPHLSYTHPAPAIWCAWAPGRLRCASCAHTAHQRIKGTREDRTCDHCRETGPLIHADMAQLPAVVVDLAPWPAQCVPPVTITFGLCPRCQHADKEKPA